MDNKELGVFISGIDVVNGMRFAIENKVFNIDTSGETLEEIAQKTGLHINRVDALIRVGLYYGFLKETEGTFFLTADGSALIDRGGSSYVLMHLFDNIQNMQRAVRLDFFETSQFGESIDQIAARIGIASEEVHALANTALSAHVLLEAGKKYYLSEEGKTFLAKDSPYSMREIFAWLPLNYDMFKMSYEGCHPPIFGANEEIARLMLGMMHQKSAWLAGCWPKQVDLSNTKTLLDVGAGSGVHVIEACRRYENLHGIALDLPWNCPFIGEFIDRYGMSAKVSAFSADMFKDTWPQVEAIVMCDIIHDWNDDSVDKLLIKARESLPLGGKIIVLETLFDENRTSPFNAVAYNISVVKMLEMGGQRTKRQILRMLEKASFGEIEFIPTSSGATLIQAVKL